MAAFIASLIGIIIGAVLAPTVTWLAMWLFSDGFAEKAYPLDAVLLMHFLVGGGFLAAAIPLCAVVFALAGTLRPERINRHLYSTFVATLIAGLLTVFVHLIWGEVQDIDDFLYVFIYFAVYALLIAFIYDLYSPRSKNA